MQTRKYFGTEEENALGLGGYMGQGKGCTNKENIDR